MGPDQVTTLTAVHLRNPAPAEATQAAPIEAVWVGVVAPFWIMSATASACRSVGDLGPCNFHRDMHMMPDYAD